MKASGGVVFSAIVVFIGCAFTLLIGGFAVVSLATDRPPVAQAAIFQYASIFMLCAMLGAAAWGIATGICLLRVKQWARISMLVFGVLLLLTCIPAVLIFLVIAIPVPPNSGDREFAHHMMAVIRISMAGFYGTLAVLGGWWIYYFNRNSVKALFRGAATAEFAVQRSPSAPRRPVSITVIAWFMLIGACSAVLTLPFYRFLFPGHQIPIFMLGFPVFGWRGIAVYFCFIGLQLVAAIGLLKIRPWGRTLAIWLQFFGLLNLALLVGIPASRARFQEMILAMQPSYLKSSEALHFPVWTGVIASLPVIVVILWFLVTQKEAFLNRENAPSLISER